MFSLTEVRVTRTRFPDSKIDFMSYLEVESLPKVTDHCFGCAVRSEARHTNVG